jgi:transposase
VKPISTDLRRRIWEFLGSTGATVEETATHFMVGSATVKRILRRLRETGSLEPKRATGGKAPRIPDEKLGVIRVIVETNNDATLQDICDRWFDRTGDRVSISTMSRVVERAGLTLKKSPSEPAAASSPKSSSGGASSSTRSRSGSSRRSSTSTSAA